ncbi:MAG: hypothetical protein JWQ10_394 [Herbaspirillum sp.]|nr:hypothetical protein [Herbaspirillum sp.]
MSSSVAICHAKSTTYIDHLSDFRNYSASDNSFSCESPYTHLSYLTMEICQRQTISSVTKCLSQIFGFKLMACGTTPDFPSTQLHEPMTNYTNLRELHCVHMRNDIPAGSQGLI